MSAADDTEQNQPDHLREGRPSGGLRLGVRLPAVLGLVLFTFFFGIVALDSLGIVQSGADAAPDDPPPSPIARMGAAHPAEAVHVVGAIGVIAIGGSGLMALVARPGSRGVAWHVLAAMAAVLITLPVVGDPNNVGGQAGPIDPVLLVLVVPGFVAALAARPWRGRRAGRQPRMLLLAAVASFPFAWYGISQALSQRNTFPPTADPHHNAHWWAMAIAAFMVILVTAAAGLPDAGWRLGARTAGATAAAVGVASLLDSDAASAVAGPIAIAVVVWGIVVIGLTFGRDYVTLRSRAP